MKKNVGNLDKLARIVLAAVLGGLFFAKILTGFWGYGALILAAIFLLTSVISFCPIYAVFGMNSCPKD